MKKSGFTLIETLVAVSVLTVFFMAVTYILQSVLENIGQSRVRGTALSIAQEKMETIRNLPYASVGTINGIPAGTLAATETVTVNSLPFTVTTSVIYMDDPYDGQAPADTINTDYKKARVEITWSGAYASRKPLSLVSLVVPKDKETITGGGTLGITVYNSLSQPVSNAVVTVDNTSITPQIHMITLTGADGKIILPGAGPCLTCYRITVTKPGFSTDRTYGSSEVANPLQPHATVIENAVTNLAFSIDEISSLTVQSVNVLGNPQTFVQFTLKGSKIIGYDTNDNPVLKYIYTANTGFSTVNIPGLETDVYSIDLGSGYTLAGANPLLPVSIEPKTAATVRMMVFNGVTSSLLVIAKNPGGTPLASASALLTDTHSGLTLAKYTGASDAANFGQAFFGYIPPSVYDLTIDLTGYIISTTSVTVSSNQVEPVTLNPIL